MLMAAPATPTSRVAYRSTTAAAGSSRNDSSTAAGTKPGAATSRLQASGVTRANHTALRIIASVVSMPPNITTAASGTDSVGVVGDSSVRSMVMARAPAAVTGVPAATPATESTISR